MDSVNCVDSIYDLNSKDNNEVNVLEKIPSNVDTEKNLIDKIVIKQAIEKLNKRDREIILLRYFKGSTQMQVAKILGISQVQVSRIEKKVLANMRASLA